MSRLKIIITTAFIFSYGYIMAQNEIGTKVVHILKTYTPNIATSTKQRTLVSDKDIPQFIKHTVSYNIHSVPVASTFVPDKGKAQKLSLIPKSFSDSYISLKGGNYTNFLTDAFINIPLEQGTITTWLNHHNTLEKIKNVNRPTDFSNTDLQIAYQFSNSNYNAGVGASLGVHTGHWYGLRNNNITLPTDFSLRYLYFLGGLEGFFTTNNSFLNRVDLTFNTIFDKFKNKEFHIKATPSLLFFINDLPFTIDGYFDFLSSTFHLSNTLNSKETIENQSFLIGIRPSYQFHINDNFSTKISLQFYSINSKIKNQFRLFPNIEISYLSLNQIIPYIGIRSDVKQNTFRELTLKNPFIAPELDFLPTSKLFDFFVGIRGVFDEVFSYDAHIGVSKTENLMLIEAKNFIPKLIEPLSPYLIENSFSTTYDNSTALYFTGKLNAKITKKLETGINLNLQKYNLEKQSKAWNIPLVESYIFAQYEILPKWFIGTNMLYVGHRYDHTFNALQEERIHKLQPSWNWNFNTQYSFGRWTVQGDLLNTLGHTHYNWIGYNTYGTQFLIGVQYQFSL